MTTTALAPAATKTAPPSLEARMAATDADMAVRCQTAGLAVDVNTAHLPTTPNWQAAVRGPVTMPQPAVDLYPTPVAALLQRAHQRLTRDGWCCGYAVDGKGAICLQWAIHKEAGGDARLEAAGLNHLLDTIRRRFGQWESVPSWNDAQTSPSAPIRILGEAADTAHNQGK